jgi:spermidine synthase
VDFVEIDPAVPVVAKKYFGFALAPGDRLEVMDARRFLDANDRRWDVAYVDTYIGDSVPFHLATKEFFELLRSRLSPDGVVSLNLAAGLNFPFPRAIYRTLAEVFPTLYAFSSPRAGNLLVLATLEEHRTPREALQARAAELDQRAKLELGFTEMVDELMVEVSFETLGVAPLLDQHAPVERLIHLGRSSVPAGEAR